MPLSFARLVPHRVSDSEGNPEYTAYKKRRWGNISRKSHRVECIKLLKIRGIDTEASLSGANAAADTIHNEILKFLSWTTITPTNFQFKATCTRVSGRGKFETLKSNRTNVDPEVKKSIGNGES